MFQKTLARHKSGPGYVIGGSERAKGQFDETLRVARLEQDKNTFLDIQRKYLVRICSSAISNFDGGFKPPRGVLIKIDNGTDPSYFAWRFCQATICPTKYLNHSSPRSSAS